MTTIIYLVEPTTDIWKRHVINVLPQLHIVLSRYSAKLSDNPHHDAPLPKLQFSDTTR